MTEVSSSSCYSDVHSASLSDLKACSRTLSWDSSLSVVLFWSLSQVSVLLCLSSGAAVSKLTVHVLHVELTLVPAGRSKKQRISSGVFTTEKLKSCEAVKTCC